MRLSARLRPWRPVREVLPQTSPRMTSAIRTGKPARLTADSGSKRRPKVRGQFPIRSFYQQVSGFFFHERRRGNMYVRTCIPHTPLWPFERSQPTIVSTISHLRLWMTITPQVEAMFIEQKCAARYPRTPVRAPSI